MKKILFTIVLAAFGLATTAQDTLYSAPPLMGMGQTSYFIPGNWWQEYEEEGDLTGCNVEDRIAEVAYRLYTDDSLVVYGIAAGLSTRDLMYPEECGPGAPERAWYLADITDTTFNEVYDYLRLYEADSNSLRPLGEDLKVHITRTPVSYYWNINLVRIVSGDPLPVVPIYERYFTDPVTVVDSFYIGRKAHTHRRDSVRSTRDAVYYTTRPIEDYQLSNGGQMFLPGAVFADKSPLGQPHIDMLEYYGWWYSERLVGFSPIIFPILTPNPDTVGDSLSIGTVSLLDRLTGIMPNPANDMVKVVSSFGISLVEVLSLSGDLLLSQRANGLSTTINVSHLPSGTYLVRITTPQGVTTRKLVKR